MSSMSPFIYIYKENGIVNIQIDYAGVTTNFYKATEADVFRETKTNSDGTSYEVYNVKTKEGGNSTLTNAIALPEIKEKDHIIIEGSLPFPIANVKPESTLDSTLPPLSKGKSIIVFETDLTSSGSIES